MQGSVAQSGDGKKRHFTMIDYELLNGVLTPFELAVWCQLKKHEASETHECWPSQETIAADAKCSVRQVQRALQSLEEDLGLVKARLRYPGQMRRGDLYTLLPVPESGLIRRVSANRTRLTGGFEHDSQAGSNTTDRRVELDPVKELDPSELDPRTTPSGGFASSGSCSPSAEARSAASPEPGPARRVLTPEEEEEREQRARDYHDYQERLNGGSRKYGRKPEEEKPHLVM